MMKEIGSEKSTPQCPFHTGGRGVQSYLGNTHRETTHLIRGFPQEKWVCRGVCTGPTVDPNIFACKILETSRGGGCRGACEMVQWGAFGVMDQ